jgi:hypothetical protein
MEEPSGLVEGARNVYRKVQKYLGDPDKESKRAFLKDTADHAWMAKRVADATASFAKKGVGAKPAVGKQKARSAKIRSAKKMRK